MDTLPPPVNPQMHVLLSYLQKELEKYVVISTSMEALSHKREKELIYRKGHQMLGHLE